VQAGVAIIGGLIASQLLTQLTTPVVYVLLDRLRRNKGFGAPKPASPASPAPPIAIEATPIASSRRCC